MFSDCIISKQQLSYFDDFMQMRTCSSQFLLVGGTLVLKLPELWHSLVFINAWWVFFPLVFFYTSFNLVLFILAMVGERGSVSVMLRGCSFWARLGKLVRADGKIDGATWRANPGNRPVRGREYTGDKGGCSLFSRKVTLNTQPALECNNLSQSIFTC